MITEAGQDLDDLMLLAEADITSKNPVKVANFLKNFAILRQRVQEVIEKDDYRNWKNPIKGEEIMKTFQIPPSRIVGDILQDIKDAIMNCEIENTHQAAFDRMLVTAKNKGLSPKT